MLVIFKNIRNRCLPRHAGTFETFRTEFRRENFWVGSRSVFLKIISARTDSSVYEDSGNKFEGFRGQAICYQKSKILKNL